MPIFEVIIISVLGPSNYAVLLNLSNGTAKFEQVEETSIELLLLFALAFVPVLTISILSKFEIELSVTLISIYSFKEKDRLS